MVERFPRNKSTRLYTVSSRASACVTRDPVPGGWQVRLPQRPEVSSKQATPSPLPNRLRQPLNKKGYKDKRPAKKQAPNPAPLNPNPRQSATFIRENLREPYDPGASLLKKVVKGW